MTVGLNKGRSQTISIKWSSFPLPLSSVVPGVPLVCPSGSKQAATLTTATRTYQRFLLHALHHHENDLLCLGATVVERFLDGDQQLVFDVVAQHPGATNTSQSLDTNPDRRNHVADCDPFSSRQTFDRLRTSCSSPVFFTVSVCKGDDVRGSATAVTDDNRHRGLLP